MPDRLYAVKQVYTGEIHNFTASENDYKIRDAVIIASRYGRDLGVILGMAKEVTRFKKNTGRSQKQAAIIRLATPEDLKNYEKNMSKERENFKICRDKIDRRDLKMKLIGVHLLLDENKMVAFFTADARIDFRELVKDLVDHFKMRIELRQIGVRDESRMLGGMAICGRVLCCHKITDKLKSVSIKMVREQDLTLNSTKISGPCGRLLCCLAYEHDFYRECAKIYPSMNSAIYYQGEKYKIKEINVLKRTLTVCSEKGETAHFSLTQTRHSKENGQWSIIGQPDPDIFASKKD